MRKIALWLAGLLCAIAPAVSAQDLNRNLPVDPQVRIGRLDNGLVYYLRQNAKPENRVMMQLVVNAGSICESDDQTGLAHFCEHMMFNGTEHFPKNELVDFLQSTGVRFGGDINAYTTFDETVYMLEIPTDKEGLLEKGYQVLEDWAHQATLDSQAIDEERGVIIEEWRMGLGADDRMRQKTLPVLLNNSRYAERMPIGKIDNLRTFKPESLRRFYRDFYRPDLQAVIVVGDIDLDAAEAQIKQRFGALQNPADAPARPYATVPDNAKPLVVVATDKEATNNTLVVFFKQPYRPIVTVGDFRNDLLRD
ncbi:MAG: insulinase family protein, partial [Bacteroidales bacterium]|nr:insulinase family protein [Bacteroidales bacterium]